MADKKLKYEHPFRIIDIKTNSFFVKDLNVNEAENFAEEDLKYKIRPTFGFEENKRLIKINLVIIYSYKKEEYLKIDVDTIYEIAQIQELNLHEVGLLSILLGIAFSTTRGIILNLTVGNVMNKFYLPIINPTEIVEAEFKKLPTTRTV
jgi:hypothetical protein